MKTFSALLLSLLLTGAVLAAPPHKAGKKPAPDAQASPTQTLPALPVAPLAPPAAPAPDVALPPSASDDVTLYDGQAASDAGLSLSAWGAGTAAETGALSLAHGHSLLVTTLDPYQGGTLTFAKPADINAPDPDKTRTLVLVLRPASVTRQYLTPAPSPAPSGPPSDTPGPFGPNAALPGSVPPAVRFAVWGSGQEASVQMAQYGGGVSGLSALRTLHMIWTFAGGKQVDMVRPFPVPASGDPDEWVKMGVPVAALRLPAGPAALQSLTLAGDDFGAFYVGQIKLVRDTAPLTCFAGDEQRVAAGDAVTLRATAGGGLSTLQYSWDFDASDGVTAQAEGPTVTTQYFDGGKNYKVTLTVTDRDGLKSPATATTIVHVQ